MKGLPEERTLALARYIVESGATVRQAAAKFGVSKSTVHKDITARLRRQNAVLYAEVQAVLLRNKRDAPQIPRGEAKENRLSQRKAG